MAPISAPLLAPVLVPFLDPNRTTQKGSFVEEYVDFQDLGRPNWEPILDPFRTHFRVLFGIISGPLWYLLKSFPTRLAELPDLLLTRKPLLAALDLLEKVSRPGSRGPDGLITYQKAFSGRPGLIEKFPSPARGARPDLLLTRKLFLAIVDLLKSFPSRLAGPGRTYYLSENFSWPLWTY